MIRPGPRNLQHDCRGLRVGNAQVAASGPARPSWWARRPFTAAVHCHAERRARGKLTCWPPTRTAGMEADALGSVRRSSFLLDAGVGLAEGLRAQGGRAWVTRPCIRARAFLCSTDQRQATKPGREPHKRLGAEALARRRRASRLAPKGRARALTQIWRAAGVASAVMNAIPVGAACGGVERAGRCTVGTARRFLGGTLGDGGEFGGLAMPSVRPRCVLPSDSRRNDTAITPPSPSSRPMQP